MVLEAVGRGRGRSVFDAALYTDYRLFKPGDSHAASIGTDCSNYVVCRRPAQMIFLFLCHRKLRSMT